MAFPLQRTTGIGGGVDNDPALPCRAETGRPNSPVALIQTLRRLAPNQWLTLQSYVFVTGDAGSMARNARHWQDTGRDDRSATAGTTTGGS